MTDFRASAKALQAAGKTLEAAQTLVNGGDVEAAAMLLFREKRYADAARALLSAVGTSPEALGTLTGERRRLAERAASYFARAGDDAAAASIYEALGDQKQARRFQDRARARAAVRRTDQHTPIQPNWQAALATAAELERQGQYEQAAHLYVKLSDRDSVERIAPALPARTAATALSLVGSLYRAAGCCLAADDKLTAYECLVRVPTTDHNYQDACRLVVQLVQPLGFADDRLIQFLAPWADHPWPPMEDLELLCQVAVLRAKIGQGESARELLLRILQVSPSYGEAQRALQLVDNVPVVEGHTEETIDRVLSDSLPDPLKTEQRKLALKSDALAPDTVVGGRYRLVKKLGRGGMGVVFQALDEELSENVALKFLLPLDDKSAVARFKREITMNRKLVHANIVRVFDLGMHEDMRYVTMELLSGEDLFSRKRRPIEMQVAVDIFTQICRGLEEAHSRGIVHRDIKPANIFITTSGVVKVMDFGIARENNAQGLTQVGQFVGTPRYMAPEHFIGEAGPAADLYSVGITAYEVLCGRPPFNETEALPLMWKHAGEAPVPPIEHNRAIPEQLNALVLKLLEKRPDARPKSAKEVAEKLEAIAGWLALNAPTIQDQDDDDLFSRD